MEPIILKKNIKHLYIKIKPPNGQVVVSAPKTMKNKEIQRVLDNSKEWIKTKQKKFENYPQPIQFESGDFVPLWGKTYPLKIIHEKPYRCIFEKDELTLSIAKNSSLEERQHIIHEFYRQEIAKILPEKSAHWKTVVGVECDDFRIRKMTTRWGTCNITARRIWVSLFLAEHPPECFDYLLVHELCHLLEKGHNKRFWGFVSKYYPNWKEVRNLLNNRR